MADVLDIDNAEEFEVDEDGDRKYFMVKIEKIPNLTSNCCRGNRPDAEGQGAEAKGTRFRQRGQRPGANRKVRECQGGG